MPLLLLTPSDANLLNGDRSVLLVGGLHVLGARILDPRPQIHKKDTSDEEDLEFPWLGSWGKQPQDPTERKLQELKVVASSRV